MTDTQLLLGIIQNDNRAWRYICRNMRFGFESIIKESFSHVSISQEDIEDLFQESCIVLMQNAKEGKVVVSRKGAIFSYLVEVGKLKTCNLLRKKSCITSDDMVTFSHNLHNNMDEYSDISIDEKQEMQNDFLDKVLEQLSAECKTLLKQFYWDNKPMDEIACIIGMRNADSVKSKKSKCMNKAKEIAAQLVESEEFAEDVIRNAVERAALIELIKDEMSYADSGYIIAALDVDDEEEDE